MKLRQMILAISGVALLAVSVLAAVPHLINFQGLLKDGSGNPVSNGSYSVIFTIYDSATGGINLWTETQSVTTIGGNFTTLLGSGTAIPDSTFNDSTRYLGIKVGADPEMTPRQRLASVGYSYVSSQWTSAGQDLFRVNGNVGIGTGPSPGYKLWVYNLGSSPFALRGVIGEADNSSFGDAYGGYFRGNSSSGGSGYGVYASGGTHGVDAIGGTYGVDATGGSYGVIGHTSLGTGVWGTSSSGDGVIGSSLSNDGVVGTSTSGTGVYASSSSGPGIEAFGGTNGVEATGTARGVYATGGDYGIVASGGTYGVYGASSVSSFSPVYGCYGAATNTSTGHAYGGNFYGFSTGGGIGYGVSGTGSLFGVYGSGGYGVYGVSSTNGGYGVFGSNGGNSATWAGYFLGDTRVTGNLEVLGFIFKPGGGFKIDHPTDPANKYLYHSFVESPDMKNIYDGVVTIDAKGEAIVTLPDWFGAVNKDFRYQLTCIGGFAPVYVSEEISTNQFKIAGGTAGMKVSWQVTGIRQDAYANDHRIQVEEDKPVAERGKYLHPKELGMPEALGVNYEMTQKMEAERKQQEEQQVKMEPKH